MGIVRVTGLLRYDEKVDDAGTDARTPHPDVRAFLDYACDLDTDCASNTSNTSSIATHVS